MLPHLRVIPVFYNSPAHSAYTPDTLMQYDLIFSLESISFVYNPPLLCVVSQGHIICYYIIRVDDLTYHISGTQKKIYQILMNE